MESQLHIMGVVVFVLAAFVGHHVVHGVPPLLHTPLMSATNAISAISVVAAIMVAGAEFEAVRTTLGVVAVAAATCNVVGGFLITDRMLKMFKGGGRKPGAGGSGGGGGQAKPVVAPVPAEHPKRPMAVARSAEGAAPGPSADGAAPADATPVAATPAAAAPEVRA